MGKFFKRIYDSGMKHNTVFWVCLVVAIFLIVGGALTPPYFVIDSSIFIGTGELWLFAALGSIVRALDKGQDTTATIKKGDAEITITAGEHNNNKE